MFFEKSYSDWILDPYPNMDMRGFRFRVEAVRRKKKALGTAGN